MNQAATNTRSFVTAWCLYLLIAEFLAAGFVRTPTPLDFQAFYSAGYLVRTNPSQLYNLEAQKRVQHEIEARKYSSAFYHPSYEALFYAPLSMLSYSSAYFVLVALNTLFLLAVFFTARPAFSTSIPLLQSQPGLMIFLFFPVLFALIFGQNSILLLLLCCLAWRELESGKPLTAGCVLALALFKFQIVLPMAFLIAVRYGRRFTYGFLLTAAGLVLVSISILGKAGSMEYIRVISGAASAIDKSAEAQQILNISPLAMPNMTGLIYACGGRLLRSAMAFDALTGICAFGIFTWCALVIRRLDRGVAFSAAILCGLLVSYHLYGYDLTLCLLPMALLSARVHRYIILAMFVLPILLLPFGWAWFFLLAVPVLVMFLNALISPAESAILTNQTRQTSPI